MSDIKCVYLSAEAYERCCRIGLEELAYQKPAGKPDSWFSRKSNCWISPNVFREIWGERRPIYRSRRMIN